MVGCRIVRWRPEKGVSLLFSESSKNESPTNSFQKSLANAFLWGKPAFLLILKKQKQPAVRKCWWIKLSSYLWCKSQYESIHRPLDQHSLFQKKDSRQDLFSEERQRRLKKDWLQLFRKWVLSSVVEAFRMTINLSLNEAVVWSAHTGTALETALPFILGHFPLNRYEVSRCFVPSERSPLMSKIHRH